VARKRKTWREKLRDAKAKPGLPRVFYCEDAKQNIVVPSPGEIEQMIRGVPAGKLLTIREIAQRLTAKHEADTACPMTTGIFAWIIAHAAEEEAVESAADAQPGVPWWRVLKTGGEINPKYPGAGQTQKKRLEAEGHKVVAKGKKLVVADYEQSLCEPA
jgi:alkylated DNA nucleotide flippase Atl1